MHVSRRLHDTRSGSLSPQQVSPSGITFSKTTRQLHVRTFEASHTTADSAIARHDAEAIVPTLQACIAVSEEIGRSDMHDWAFEQLGRCLNKLGKHEAALAAHSKELEVTISLRNVIGEGHACCNIARAHAGLKRWARCASDGCCVTTVLRMRCARSLTGAHVTVMIVILSFSD